MNIICRFTGFARDGLVFTAVICHILTDLFCRILAILQVMSRCQVNAVGDIRNSVRLTSIVLHLK